ncbi:LETM1 domain-containing protein [Lutibacter sp.]|uniref:LETM1 domain-containing protein n=1 Tax=Lutibacter sp. TaxID=1925666 RepID=UPI0025BF4AF4|nr:LETM1 domain-containing protein [Lutibacter sp.]MCF6182208.1 LETM1 domain-containing protein [Lutibacter sp.]
MSQKEENKNKLIIDLSVFEADNKKEFSQIIIKNKKKVTKVLIDFFDGLKNEATDSRETSRIIYKFILEQKITKAEEKQLKTKVADMFKIIGVGVPFMIIPGASILIPFLLKIAEKNGIDLYPSNFNGKK